MNPQPQPTAPSTIDSGLNAASNAFGSITSSITDARTNLNAAVSDFSSKSAVDASSEFLESNTIVAKFAFIIVVLVGFMLLFRLGAIIMSYFFMPTGSPYLVQGKISGSEAIVIKQDTRSSFPIVKLSEDATTGIEFTYNVWVYLTGESTPDTYKHVFNKGTLGTTAGNTNNAPGLYVKTNANGTNSARIYMDTMQEDGALASGTSSKSVFVDLNELPNNKWINISIRLQNRIMDIYVNGVLTGRKDLEYVPRQNYGVVNVCANSGFSGSLSNLRYYDSALNVFQINQIVASGPDLSSSKSGASSEMSGFYYYLSSQFYQNNL
jgi:hypothetical protein